MTKRCLFAILAITVLFYRPVAVEARHTWDPAVAVADADRDIAAGRVRFCFIGGYASYAPGLPDQAARLVSSYPHIAVGPQGCVQSAQDLANHLVYTEYARRYNLHMWAYVSTRRHLTNR
jgi:hypothetical protein